MPVNPLTTRPSDVIFFIGIGETGVPRGKIGKYWDVLMSNLRSLIFKVLLPVLFLLPGGAFRLGAEEAGSPFSTPEFAEARKLIQEKKAECVMIRGRELDVKRGRGVMPLLEFHDRRPNAMKGAVIVDKVIGRAAAAVAISGGVRAVHGEIMSEDGKAYLEKHGIATNHGLLVPRILNADRSGLCPLEKSVEGIDDPDEKKRHLAKFNYLLNLRNIDDYHLLFDSVNSHSLIAENHVIHVCPVCGAKVDIVYPFRTDQYVSGI